MGRYLSMNRWLGTAAALGFAVLLTGLSVVEAATVSRTIGGRQVNLVIDPDQCELDRNNPSDKRVYELVERALQGQNQLLMSAADCQQLPEWRRGQRPTLDDFTQVQVGLTYINQDLTGRETATVQEICAFLRKQGDAFVAGPMVEFRERFNRATGDVKLNETTFIGVVHEDNRACYASLVQKVRTDQGRDKLILSVFAHVVIRGRLLYIYRYTEGESFASMVKLTDLLKETVAAHLDANR